MATILKQLYGGFIVAGPRRNKKEGVLYSMERADALRFESEADAKNWLAAVQENQRKLGMKPREIARAYAVTL